jgi:hypothetical protein
LPGRQRPEKDHPNAVKVHGKRIKLPMIGWLPVREALLCR